MTTTESIWNYNIKSKFLQFKWVSSKISLILLYCVNKYFFVLHVKLSICSIITYLCRFYELVFRDIFITLIITGIASNFPLPIDQIINSMHNEEHSLCVWIHFTIQSTLHYQQSLTQRNCALLLFFINNAKKNCNSWDVETDSTNQI